MGVFVQRLVVEFHRCLYSLGGPTPTKDNHVADYNFGQIFVVRDVG